MKNQANAELYNRLSASYSTIVSAHKLGLVTNKTKNDAGNVMEFITKCPLRIKRLNTSYFMGGTQYYEFK